MSSKNQPVESPKRIKRKRITVMARQKPLSELPAWALCCEQIREIYREQGDFLIVEVIPAKVFTAEVECRFCHAIIRDVRYMRATKIGGPFHSSAIPVECFDFDEGIANEN
jgi:hypothetical protein